MGQEVEKCCLDCAFYDQDNERCEWNPDAPAWYGGHVPLGNKNREISADHPFINCPAWKPGKL